MKVLVTGGAGFIGSHIVDALMARGDQVIVIDNLSTGNPANLGPGIPLHRLDIRHSATADLIRSEAPDAIVHHAAQMSVSRSVARPVFDAEVNVLGTLNLLEAATRVRARFVFASTGGALYGEADVLPTPESTPTWPISPYGVGKLASEHYLHAYHQQYGLSFAALRYANVYGPRQNAAGEAGVVAVFSSSLLDGAVPTIYGDGLQTRDLIYVADVVRANLAALDSTRCGHFNVGTGQQTSVQELYAAIALLTGSQLEPDYGPPRAGDLRRSALDCRLIARELGWHPEFALQQGLRQTVASFRSTTSNFLLPQGEAIWRTSP
ncbi:MAG: UDP-glucose 4-epimerase [Chloroflexota bacterium]|jgi:UDP-glucose 4-epimerase|nr:UDP-glucose 4-epimerase [Chloroflexota bacterium]